MTGQSPLQEFFALAKHAAQIETDISGGPVEPSFEAVLDYVIARPNSRSEFATAFLELALDPDKAPPELVEFCMHALRWPEVRQAIKDRLEHETSGRVRHVLMGIDLAFSDDWYDADAYDRFDQ